MGDVAALFTELDGLLKGNDLEKALATSEKILQIDAKDQDAFACQCFCLIQLGRFQETLQLLDDSPHASSFAFERAYCLYRMKDHAAALKVLESSRSDEARFVQLEAQVRYGLEDYEGSVRLYNELINKHNMDSLELKTNLCAALALSNEKEQCRNFLSANQDTLQEMFEFAYNAACVSIGLDDVSTAEQQLELSQKLCKASFEEDELTEEELQDELAIIRVQIAYLKHIKNQVDDAGEIYKAVLEAKPSDSSVSAVAANNLAATRKDRDLFDSEKKLRSASNKELQLRLLSSQREVIAFNHCLLYLHMKKAQQAKEALEEFEKQFPESSLLPLLKASVCYRTKQPAECERILQEVLQGPQRESKEGIRAALSLAQLHLLKGELKEAVSLLTSLDSLRTSPGATSALVALYEHLGNISAALKTFDSYVAYWEKRIGNGQPQQKQQYKQVLQASARFKVKHGLFQQAAAVYERLLELDRNDVEALTSLVLVCSEFDNNLAEKYAARIPPLKTGASVDAESLENAATPTATFISRAQKDKSKEGAPSDSKTSQQNKPTTALKKKKKKKKIRYPKNYDPSVQPDPERWLPKHERSYYKRRGKKNQIGRGPQGAAPTPADASSGTSSSPTTKKTETTTGSSKTVPTVPQPKGGRKGGKKRKGGRR
ncbi:Signal recognition particle core component [Balamuthia mandrillaris]